MSEKELNEILIKFEIQEICQNCVHLDKIVPIIREMLSEEYKTGLEQSRFDKIMLEHELDQYKGLYQNEKDKNDTLNRIIKKIEEYVENTDCVTWDNQAHEDILDLLKEIK